jgi:hypothetical protein
MDKACEYLGARKLCVTATTTVPGVEQGHYWLGHRLHEVEENRLQSELVCECELVTRAMLEEYFSDTMEALAIVFTDEELAKLRTAAVADRASEWKALWARRDPDPATPENEAPPKRTTMALPRK